MKKIINLSLSNLIILYYSIFRFLSHRKSSAKDFTILVVSMDRPFALRSFLLSVERHFLDAPKIVAIIRYSDGNQFKRYEKLRRELSGVLQVEFCYEQVGFKHSLSTVLRNLEIARVMLCVDDQVFFRNAAYADITTAGQKVDFFTLRFGKDTTYSYNLDVQMKQPFHDEAGVEYLEWPCRVLKDDFHYPLSFDTTIMDLFLLKLMSNLLLFNSPNQFESYMNYGIYTAALCRLKIGCPKKQIAVNFVLNKVQEDNDNKSLGISGSQLNQYFDEGDYIEADITSFNAFNSSHMVNHYRIDKIK